MCLPAKEWWAMSSVASENNWTSYLETHRLRKRAFTVYTILFLHISSVSFWLYYKVGVSYIYWTPYAFCAKLRMQTCSLLTSFTFLRIKLICTFCWSSTCQLVSRNAVLRFCFHSILRSDCQNTCRVYAGPEWGFKTRRHVFTQQLCLCSVRLATHRSSKPTRQKRMT